MNLFDILIGFLIFNVIFSISERYKRISFFVNLLALVLLTGTMYENAYGDYTAYRLSFENMEISLKIPSGEIGIYYLNLIIKLFTDKFTRAFFIYMLFINFFILKFIYNNSKNIDASILMYVVLGGYYSTPNIVRQYLAISIYLMAINYLLYKDYKKYIIISILAFCFHKSIFIAIIFTLFVKIFNEKLYKYYFIFFIVCNGLIVIEPIIRKVGIEILYSEYSMDSFNYGSNILHYIVQLFFIAFYLICKKYINRESEKFYINMVMIGLTFTLLSQNMVLYARFATYFTFFNIIAFVNIGHKLPIKFKRLVGYAAILLILVYYKMLASTLMKVMNNYFVEFLYRR